MSVESSYSKKGFLLLLLWLLSVSNEDTLTVTEAFMASVIAAVFITDTTRHMKAIFFK